MRRLSSRESPVVDDDEEQRPAQRSPVPSASDLVDQLVQAVLRARHGGGRRDARFGAFADADPRDLLRLPDKFRPAFPVIQRTLPPATSKVKCNHSAFNFK